MLVKSTFKMFTGNINFERREALAKADTRGAQNEI